MSAGLQSAERHNCGLSSNNGAHVSYFESPNHSKLRQAEAATTETQDASRRLRFNSMTLDELSEELDRRTKATQRLQEVVEKATKETLERFGWIYAPNNSPGQNVCEDSQSTSRSPGQSCNNHRFNVYDPPVDFNVCSPHQHMLTEPWLCDQDSVNQAVDQNVVSIAEKELLDNAVDVCLQQLSDMQLNKTQDQPKQETLCFDKAIVNLQTKLHKVQMEKDVQSDLRLKDSRKHVDQMEQMMYMLEDLQNSKRTVDQKLQETEDEILGLNRKVETLERVIKDTNSSLLSRCSNDAITSLNITTGSSQAAKLTDYFTNEMDKLQEKVVLSVEHLGSEEFHGTNKKKERMEDLIVGLDQEMALLTDILSSSKKHSVSLSVKLELLKKLAERQTSLHQCQVNELQSAVFSHKDKICSLEQQLIQAQSQLVDAQTKRKRSLQQAEELQSQFVHLKRCGEQQQLELQVVANALRGQLEVAREQFHRGEEEKICLQALLEQRVQEERESQELLQEKDEKLKLRQQETQQYLSRLEEAQSQCQTLHAEGEMLRLKLEDREKMMHILRLQTESSIQTIEQHSHTIENLHQENSLLSNQLNQHKLEILHLRAELDQHKSDLAAAGQEKQQLQISVAEQSQRVREGTQKKQQLITQLEAQRIQLLTLRKEHKELQSLHSCITEEQKGVVLELQSQLRNTHDELDQVRTTLRTLERADEHGLQVAMDMQKEITARREQVDMLQGKILHLEEAIDKMYQEKRYQNLENQHQLQELSFIKEEKRQLADELETLRSKDQQLRDRICELEAILHKLQEQQFFRLKLQHALDLKELQGKHLHRVRSEPPSVQYPMTPSAVSAPPSFQHSCNTQSKAKRQQENPAQEHRSVTKELQRVISKNCRPHTDNSAVDSSFQRRRSAPERVHSTAFSISKTKEVKADSILRRKTYGSEPHLLTTVELNGKIINNKSNENCVISIPPPAPRYTSSPLLLSLGRRSPVHSLLTSDPNS